MNYGYAGLWYEDEFDLTLVPLPKIVITTDGKTTLARLYDGKKIIKTAEAKCHPEDEFDFAIGANLAFERLMGFEPYAEPRQEPVKLYCVKASGWLTPGKIYESVDGWINTDNGERHIDTVMRENGYLYPLVKRKAKVGEWVLPPDDWCALQMAEKGIYKVVNEINDKYYDLAISNDKLLCMGEYRDYLVLDGYKPESEPKKGWTP